MELCNTSNNVSASYRRWIDNILREAVNKGSAGRLLRQVCGRLGLPKVDCISVRNHACALGERLKALPAQSRRQEWLIKIGTRCGDWSALAENALRREGIAVDEAVLTVLDGELTVDEAAGLTRWTVG